MNANISTDDAPRSAERDRVDSFGRLEDGLRQASPWYRGARTSASAPGARSGRTTAPRAGRGSYLPARAGPLARLPVERGRPRRVQRHRAAPVPGAGAVERPRPDPQGAALRPDRRRGQPRRGRQGVLVVRRRRAEPRLEPVALPLPAAGVPVRRAGRRRTARRGRPSRSSSCSTPGSSTTTATGSSRSTTPRTTPTTS